MKVLYLIQTHKNPKQIYRLISTIKRASPNSSILVSHDYKNCHLDTTALQKLSDVWVIDGQGGRGDFSIIQGYLDAIEWLFNHQISFDWLINLTGQDYPTQPLQQVEKFLAETHYDGFSSYFHAFEDCDRNIWGSKQGCDRYLYQYWRSGSYLPLWQRAILKLPRIVINHTQPWIRMNTSYGLLVGIRANPSPFNDKFICYGGSFFNTLSQKCIRYLSDFSKRNPHIVNYFQKTCIPDESFIQTVLVNSNLFNICNDRKRYMDFTGGRHGHPRVLTVDDYPLLTQENIHFARKFEPGQDEKVLDMLDARILQST